MEDRVLVEVNDLKKYFKTSKGMLHAVDGIHFKIKKGTTLGVVGASGCGKSTLGRLLLHLHEPTGGQILYDGLRRQGASGDPEKNVDDLPGSLRLSGSEKVCKGADRGAA